MNKKILAIIILIAIIGIYGLFYVAVSSVLMPLDLNGFKSDLSNMPALPVNNNSTINDLESSAASMDSYPALKYTSQNQRTQMANQMRNDNSPPPGFLNQNFTDLNTFYSISALAYELTGKEALANEINNLSSTTNKMSILTNESTTIDQKSADDLENGNNSAYANDLRDTANNMKQYNNAMADLQAQLQNIIKQLGG